MSRDNDFGEEFSETAEELREFMKDESFVHYVGMISPPRPGVRELLEFVEHEYYKPDTRRNDLFLMRIIRWEDIVWALISIPIKERSYVEKAVRSFGLRIANGVPTMLSGGKAERFPYENERTFTFENVSGHPVYRNNPLEEKRN
ncbi:MAG: hypothetical protein HGA31_02010 [Candidatus Moranbacteria bacterium]|nr:hypothetical protein [Candidatus Moranbacteria bacterium]